MSAVPSPPLVLQLSWYAERRLSASAKRDVSLTTEACLTTNSEPLLQREILLAVLLRRPDEQAGDERRDQQDEDAHHDSLRDLHG